MAAQVGSGILRPGSLHGLNELTHRFTWGAEASLSHSCDYRSSRE